MCICHLRLRWLFYKAAGFAIKLCVCHWRELFFELHILFVEQTMMNVAILFVQLKVDYFYIVSKRVFCVIVRKMFESFFFIFFQLWKLSLYISTLTERNSSARQAFFVIECLPATIILFFAVVGNSILLNISFATMAKHTALLSWFCFFFLCRRQQRIPLDILRPVALTVEFCKYFAVVFFCNLELYAKNSLILIYSCLKFLRHFPVPKLFECKQRSLPQPPLLFASLL